LALYALLLALTGLYVRQTKAVGKLGFVGYLVAFLGTLLVAGDWWYEAFVGPQLATRGLLAELYEVPFSEMGSLMVGAFVTFGLFSLGWILFGIATLRGRFFGVGPAILLIVGGAVGVMAGTPGSQIPLAIAIGWMGYLLNTSSRDDDTAA
jgi:hypothetical protein